MKSLAAAAGFAALASEQVFGASLLLRPTGELVPQDSGYCTSSGTFTETNSWVLKSYETATVEWPTDKPFTMTQSFSIPATQSESLVETFTIGAPPPGASISRTTSTQRNYNPAKSHSGVYTLSGDGKNLTTTCVRPFDLTVGETKTLTVSASYKCGGGGAVGTFASGDELVLAGLTLTALTRDTIDSPESLFGWSRGQSLRHLNL